MKYQRMNIRIPKELYDKLRIIKDENGLDMQDIISKSLLDYFKKLDDVTTNRQKR